MTFHWTKRLFSNIQQHIKNYSCIKKKKVKCMRWQATNTNVSFTVILPTHFKNTWSHNYVAHDSNRKWLFPQTFRKLCWTQTHTWHQTALHTENMCECFTYLCRTWLPVSQSSSLCLKRRHVDFHRPCLHLSLMCIHSSKNMRGPVLPGSLPTFSLCLQRPDARVLHGSWLATRPPIAR